MWIMFAYIFNKALKPYLLIACEISYTADSFLIIKDLLIGFPQL